jgi:hypothetical protein
VRRLIDKGKRPGPSADEQLNPRSHEQQLPAPKAGAVADAPPRLRRPPLLEPTNTVLTTPGPRALPHQGRQWGETCR